MQGVWLWSEHAAAQGAYLWVGKKRGEVQRGSRGRGGGKVCGISGGHSWLLRKGRYKQIKLACS
jgi:hypothetical protein